MCCIFTCCGWMIDLVQRLWTFTMACCISSAVCCALITAAMSGIALGYNYSLAEYIDLKETNVSVYLKRGVFDDEIADDLDWRRSGHMPVQGHLRDSNLMTGAPENEEMPLRAGRRMDDSLIVSDDQHDFEGSLMRLTMKPPSYVSSIQPVTSDTKIAEARLIQEEGSIDQVKAIHSLMNQRIYNDQRITKQTPGTESVLLPELNGRRVGGVAPGGVAMYQGPYGSDPYEINKARLAVPEKSVGDPANWFIPKGQFPNTYRKSIGLEDYDNVPSSIHTYPTPIHFTVEMKRPSRPTRPKPIVAIFHSSTTGPIEPIRTGGFPNEVPEAEIERFKSKLLKDNQDLTRLQNHQFRKVGGKDIFQSEEDYADQANKGLPIRKKREIIDPVTQRLHAKLFNILGDSLRFRKGMEQFDSETANETKTNEIVENNKKENKLNITINNNTVHKSNKDQFENLDNSKHNDNSKNSNITNVITNSNSYIPHNYYSKSHNDIDENGSRKFSIRLLLGKLVTEDIINLNSTEKVTTTKSNNTTQHFSPGKVGTGIFELLVTPLKGN